MKSTDGTGQPYVVNDPSYEERSGDAAWVVVIECMPANRGEAVEEWRLRRLLEHMPGVTPVGLHSTERVAVQVHLEATDEVTALGFALNGLRAALPKVGVRELRVVRAEVLTEEEFGRDCLVTYGDGSPEGCDHCGRRTIPGQTPQGAQPRLRAVDD